MLGTSRTIPLMALANLAGAAFSQHTSIEMQVSKDGFNWMSAVTVDRGAGDTGRVLVRAVATWAPDGSTTTPVGFASLTFQPVVANPRPGIDTIAPFLNAGNNSNGGSFAPDSTPLDGPFGRLEPFAGSGPASTNPATSGNHYGVFTHAANLGGAPDGTYYRIARNDISRWMGAGLTFGAAAVNNFNGAGGIACVQKAPWDVVFGINPFFHYGIDRVEFFRFALDTGPAASPWTIQILAPLEGMLRNTATGTRQGTWFATNADTSGTIKADVLVTPGSITIVPGPGALGLLAGALVVRRRRGG